MAPIIDDEKYYFKDSLSLDEANRLTRENAKDIVWGVRLDIRTFLF